VAVVTFTEALRQALQEEMQRDDRVFLMGENIRYGVYGATGQLFAEFGEERVLDTPNSEGGFIGAALGAAALGMRPVVSTSASFLWVAMDQVIQQAAKTRYMFGGQIGFPMVLRCGFAYGNSSGAHHNDRPHSMLMNVPGLKIVMPSNPAEAKGLLKTAIRDDDVVLFMEDGSLRGARGEVPEGEYTIPFGKADVKCMGKDVTVVALGGMVQQAMSAAEKLADAGISTEVIDPRCLAPLDKQAILTSVAKTGRLVVVDSAHKTCSAASEIGAMVAQEGFWSLQAPIERVCSLMVHFPYSRALEKLVFPNEEKIVAAVKATLD
jgi:pyruvate/2-oxoglutarate/acetoin dehydrogenase E1 component